ncbi:MAG: T9SS type A sorting domain-containing protein [Bacteriovoracaceae bacterium]|nr:T9SS type A sorting domain-containing protein [Bacteroidota bacterium]
MKSSKKNLTGSVITMFLLTSCLLYSQMPDFIQLYRNDEKGNMQYRKRGLLDANRVRTVFGNNGEVADWFNGSILGPHLEWPKGTGHRHLDGFTFMVGAKVKIIDANNTERFITPIETSYREEMDRDPITGTIWGFEPVPGYVNPLSTTIALSNNNNSFPSQWPAALRLSSDWNGKWYGYNGGTANENCLETFFVVDDSRDKEYTKLPYNYYPIASDSDRGGLGLRVEVRGMQFQHFLLQDMIFWNYSVTNISDVNYDSTAFGVFMDPSVGSNTNDGRTNSNLNLMYFWSPSGIGLPDNYTTGYLGISILHSPTAANNKNIGSVYLGLLSDKGETGVWPRNDLRMWSAMTGGIKDTSIYNANISTVVGSSVFQFPKWSTEQYDVAMILGKTLSDITMKNFVAQKVFDHHFVISDSIGSLGNFSLALTTPTEYSTVSGIVNIGWNVQGAVGKTTSYLYCSRNDEEWFLVGIDTVGTGTLQWNSTLYPDGIFYTLRVVTVAENGTGFAEYRNSIRVNNAGQAKPEIRMNKPKQFITIQGDVELQWNGGDADGDACTVNLFYRSYYQQAWTPIQLNIKTSIGIGTIVWDTRTAPNSNQFDYELKAEIISQSDTAVAVLRDICIKNPVVHKSIDPFIVTRKGSGTGAISVGIVDTTAISGHQYLITFEEETPFLTAAVTNKNTGVRKLSRIFPLDINHDTQTFDGIRLRIINDSIQLDAEFTGWMNGTTAFPMVPKFDNSIVSRNAQLPYDYLIPFSNVAIDTPILASPPKYIKVPVPFTIQNTTLQRKAYSLLEDVDRNGTLSFGDSIRIIDDYISPTNFHIIWNIAYGSALTNLPEPTKGDVYVISTKKPFVVGDSIIFKTDGLTSVNILHSSVPVGFMLEQNYPNPFNPSTTIRYGLPSSSRVSLKIFNILGQQVIDLVDAVQSAGWHEVVWNANVASGLYFYKIEAVNNSAPSKRFTEQRKMLYIK